MEGQFFILLGGAADINGIAAVDRICQRCKGRQCVRFSAAFPVIPARFQVAQLCQFGFQTGECRPIRHREVVQHVFQKRQLVLAGCDQRLQMRFRGFQLGVFGIVLLCILLRVQANIERDHNVPTVFVIVIRQGNG